METAKLYMHVDEDAKKCWWWECPECGQAQVDYLDEQSQVLCENCDTYFDIEIVQDAKAI